MLASEQDCVTADIEAMTVADDGQEAAGPDVTGGTVPAVAVLQSIDGNTGACEKPDPRSHFPSASRGANSFAIEPSILTKLWSGRARR